MSTLLEKANLIKEEKDEKILPENIKHGVTIFGVTGTYTGDQPGPVPPPVEDDYLCFTANTAGSTLKLNRYGSPTAVELEYSTDGDTWEEFLIGTYNNPGTVITLTNVGDKVYLRGDNSIFSSNMTYYKFVMTGSIAASGNVMSLLDKTCQSTTISTIHCFGDLFEECVSLTSAPKLPATNIYYGCYSNMFTGCTNLIEPPELPATTLYSECYNYMFASCSSLQTLPELPATELSDGCYCGMFAGCSGITTVPENYLPAMELADSCYGSMFMECNNLISPPKLPATTLANGCYFDMFNGCTSLAILPELPALHIVDMCYENMFANCSNIRMSEEQVDDYVYEYRIPTSGTGDVEFEMPMGMFDSTGGTFTDTPEINTVYYTANELV